MRLTTLPLGALNIGPRVLNQLAATGFHCVGDLVHLAADQLSQQACIMTSSAGKVLDALREVANGARDPTSPGARTMDEELAEILQRTGIRDGDRAIRILESLYGLTGSTSMTLEAIGVELGVTRERVRQIRSQTEDEIWRVLRWYNASSLAAARAAVLAKGGVASLANIASAVEERVSAGRYDPHAYVKWIIEQAHDPTLTVTRGTAVVGPPLGMPCFSQIVEVVQHLLWEHHLLTPEAAAEYITETMGEMNPVYARHYATEILSRIGTQILPGHFSTQPWSRADWAEYVLKLAGRASHFSSIAARVRELTGMGFSDAGFNSVLNSDERFVRVGAGDFLLASSGVQPYGRFDEVIERYLRAAGVPVREDQIADELLRSYTVTRSTVSTMLRVNDRCFTHFGGGYWGLADLQYLTDLVLERQVLGCLQSNDEGMSVGEIRQWLLDRTKGALCPPTTSLELTLYLCPRIRRFGNSAPARFKLATALNQAHAPWPEAQTDLEIDTPLEDPLIRLKAIADLL
jgi:hypothetical protein